MANYNSKCKDSFNAKYAMFIFKLSLEWKLKSVDSYFNDEGQVSQKLIEDFHSFKLTEDFADIYSGRYMQFELDEFISYSNSYDEKQIKIIYSEITPWFQVAKSENPKSVSAQYDLYKKIYDILFDQYKVSFDKFFTKVTFEQMEKEQNCRYCGISLKQIEKLGKQAKLHNKRSDTRSLSDYPNQTTAKKQ